MTVCPARDALRGERQRFKRTAQGSAAERKAMIDRDHGLSVSRQAKVLGISRASVCYLPRPSSEADLALMRRIDELHPEYPSAGSRMRKGLLQGEGHRVGRLHVSTLMKKMAIAALYRRPSTSKPAPGHRICPYLPRNVAVTRPNQVWAMDITYIPMARGFVYLAAVIDWFSRKVLAWRLSITLSADFCLEALEEALGRYGWPEIFNSDQGSQFTSAEFIKALKNAEVAISMDGKGSAYTPTARQCLRRAALADGEPKDRAAKYEEVCLRAYGSVSEARAWMRVSVLLCIGDPVHVFRDEQGR